MGRKFEIHIACGVLSAFLANSIKEIAGKVKRVVVELALHPGSRSMLSDGDHSQHQSLTNLNRMNSQVKSGIAEAGRRIGTTAIDN
jgi:hypothetical protein